MSISFRSPLEGVKECSSSAGAREGLEGERSCDPLCVTKGKAIKIPNKRIRIALEPPYCISLIALPELCDERWSKLLSLEEEDQRTLSAPTSDRVDQPLTAYWRERFYLL